MTYQLTAHGTIRRLSDGASIPADERNADYRAFLRWKAEGNEPLPVDPPREPTPQERIVELEAQQTPRLLRSAALGDAYALAQLALIEDQIAALGVRKA